ncbi:MAG TPA: hypothetical protein VGL29_04835 [Blastocatellia bacterium]
MSDIEHVAIEGMELLGKATHLRRDFVVAGIEHVAIGYRAGRRQRS